MRITGGRYTGRTVTCPPGEIRPAMDRMRESIFSIRGALDGTSFLDLFSGSGIMALEAASRGAARVVCVEKDRKKREIILRNLSIIESGTCTHRLLIVPVERFIVRNREIFDWIFLDPPFRYGFKKDLLERISRAQTVSDTGTVVIHTPRSDTLPDQVGDLIRTDIRRYGGSVVHWYQRAD
jgi:16S rRNA (guanine966-N2)-methyltransferase